MSLTYTSARDAMFSTFKEGWEDACPIIYQDQLIQPPANGPYAEIYRQNVSENQATLCDKLGDGAKRRYEVVGILTIAIKCPLSYSNCENVVSELAQKAKSIFRGKRVACDIVFSNCRIVSQSPTSNNALTMVLCTYSYYEIA